MKKTMAVLLTLAALVALLFVLPVEAAEEGLWPVFREDFESYTPGEDTFYDANKVDYAFTPSYHGKPTDEGYSLYGIAREGEQQVLELTSVNTIRNYFVTRHKLTGAQVVTADVWLKSPAGSARPTLVLNPFQGATFGSGKPILIYVDPVSGSRISDEATTGSVVNHIVKNEAGGNLVVAYDTWYTVKLVVEPGKLTMKLWERGKAEPVSGAGVAVCESDAINAAMAKESQLRIHNMNRNKPGEGYVVRLDNLTIAKPLSGMELPGSVSGAPGQNVYLAPVFRGNDLGSQLPAPVYKVTLSDPGLATLERDGSLTLGDREGQCDLTVELTDLQGKGTGIQATAKLVVGAVNGLTVTPARLQVAEGEIGATATITAAVTAQVGNAAIHWSSSDEQVATVDQNGKVTYTGFGSATITARVQEGGKDTAYYAMIPVQVGEQPLRVLALGSGDSRDSLYYVSALAVQLGERVEVAYLDNGLGSLRSHAKAMALDTDTYRYWKANALTGRFADKGMVSVADALKDGAWDVVLLEQAGAYAGFSGSYNSDLDYLLDAVRARQPKAKLYWNMAWAWQKGCTNSDFTEFYDGDSGVMYNAIVTAMEQNIVGANSRFGKKLDGWIPTGAVIQKLSGTFGAKLTRNGEDLSLSAGRLAASMTVLKTILPQAELNTLTAAGLQTVLVKTDDGVKLTDNSGYTNNEANLTSIRNGVTSATADLSHAPSRVTVAKPARVEDAGGNNVTVGQVVAPLQIRFPDLTVLQNGTILVAGNENLSHKQTTTASDDAYGAEGSTRIVVWKSTDNGKSWNYDQPLLVVDDDQLERWGLLSAYGRYERLEKDPTANYDIMADSRDPNFGLVYTDVTGDGVKDEVVLLTFWTRFFRAESATIEGYMTWSVDAGESWAVPQRLERADGGAFVKRGDIASFSNGEILVPYYGSSKVGGVHLKWDQSSRKWVRLGDYPVPNTAPEEAANFNEVSFVAPDPDSNVVYTYIRESGVVMRSDDRGKTWVEIANEPGLIHQPGFAILDENRVFTTWAKTTANRTVYGKMFYVNAHWTDTTTQMIYDSPVTKIHDMADPSAKLLPDGRILVVCYDVAYRSIVGTFVDPNAPEYTMVEMNDAAAEAVLFEQNYYQGKTLDAAGLTLSMLLPDSYSVYTAATFEQGGKLAIHLEDATTVNFAAGADGIQTGKTYQLHVVAAGTTAYVKVWEQGSAKPESWRAVNTGSTQGSLKVFGSGVKLNSLKVSKRVYIEMPDSLNGIAGAQEVRMKASVMPAQDQVVWASSNPAVARVDQQGRVTFLAEGEATITLTAGGATASCKVTVLPQPAELTGAGTRQILFRDDFEGYNVGANAFWSAMTGKGYKSNVDKVESPLAYEIAQSGDNRYLKLHSGDKKATWHKIDVPVTGNCTVQFDFYFTGPRTATSNTAPGQYMYINLWQDSQMYYGFVHLTPEGVRVEYQQEGQTTTTKYPEAFSDQVLYELNQWHTIKLVRMDGGIFVKVWDKGAPEPESWTLSLMRPELDATQGSTIRFQYYVAGNTQQFAMDNLVLSRQTGTGAEFMGDVRNSDWHYNAVDYALKNGIMSGYNASTFGPDDNLSRAMVVQVLYNKEGKPDLGGATHAFPDVASNQWYNNAVTWGAARKVVSGYGDGRFGPNDNVTLEQVAVILWNYAGNPGSEASLDGIGTYSDWAANALRWAVAQGILDNVPYSGMTQTATRAQTAQMLMNYLKK